MHLSLSFLIAAYWLSDEMGEISNENIAVIENQEKVTEKHPMSPECNLIAFWAYWLSRFVMSNNRGDNVRLETLVMAAKLSHLRASRFL